MVFFVDVSGMFGSNGSVMRRTVNIDQLRFFFLKTNVFDKFWGHKRTHNETVGGTTLAPSAHDAEVRHVLGPREEESQCCGR